MAVVVEGLPTISRTRSPTIGGSGRSASGQLAALSYGTRFAWPVTAVVQCVLSVDVSIFQVIARSDVTLERSSEGTPSVE
jgi:hypothetical protein